VLLAIADEVIEKDAIIAVHECPEVALSGVFRCGAQNCESEELRTLLVALTVTKTGPPFRFRQSRLTSQASDHCRDIASIRLTPLKA
jgi:hypothetical protein